MYSTECSEMGYYIMLFIHNLYTATCTYCVGIIIWYVLKSVFGIAWQPISEVPFSSNATSVEIITACLQYSDATLFPSYYFNSCQFREASLIACSYI